MLTVTIDPEELLVIRFKHEGKIHSVVAFAISYVPARRAGRNLALEVLFDPRRPQRRGRYTTGEYERILIAPEAVIEIRPYLPSLIRRRAVP